jgi:hypothetical protein
VKPLTAERARSVARVAACTCRTIQAVLSHSCHRASWTMPTITPPRPLTPGLYVGRVEDVAFLTLPWRISAINPDGLAVRLGVRIEAEDGPAHVFDSIDFDHRDRLAMAYASCGRPVPSTPGHSAQELVGCECRIFTKNIVPRHGKGAGYEKAVVSSWLPQPKQSVSPRACRGGMTTTTKTGG